MKSYLNISIVLYNTDLSLISELLNFFKSENYINQIFLVDNSPIRNDKFDFDQVEYIFTGKNLGYGGGHNIAIKKSILNGIKYHLVLNPDILIQKNTLPVLLDYLESNEDVGLIMPGVKNLDGTFQLLPKLLPSPLDLLIRVVSPIGKLASKRNRLYVLADYQNKILNVPIISGCFSLFRVDSLKEVGLYDEKFFMYFEDFDISRRIHKTFKTIYYPVVSIIHHHERGASKRFKLFIVFIKSAIAYFNKYGWLIDKDRKKINKKVLLQIKQFLLTKGS